MNKCSEEVNKIKKLLDIVCVEDDDRIFGILVFINYILGLVIDDINS